jgi:hypothetical protein
LDLYPGQIFAGKVDSIWRANGSGQYLPSDEIPKFGPSPANVPQGQYAVKILMDDPDQSKFPIGAQGTAAIFTSGEHGAWAALRTISIHAHSWFNWVYAISFRHALRRVSILIRRIENELDIAGIDASLLATMSSKPGRRVPGVLGNLQPIEETKSTCTGQPP